MNTGKLPIGLYIHIPFCAGKCPYCDFYSFAADDEAMDQYCSAVVTALDSWAAKLHRPIDTLYFGGGTPSFIGAQRLAKLVGAAVSAFKTKNIGGGKPPPYRGIKAGDSLRRHIGGGKPPPYSGTKAGNSLRRHIGGGKALPYSGTKVDDSLRRHIGGGKPPPYSGTKVDDSLRRHIGGGKPLPYSGTKAGNSLRRHIGGGKALPYSGTKAGNSLRRHIGGGKPPPYSGIKARKFLTRRQTPSCQPVGRGLAPAEDNSSSLEITVECNPSNVGGPDSCFDFEKLAQSGVNRLSLGLQSAVDSERRSLGRKGSAVDVTRAIQRAKSAGITNISLDLMLGIPGQTMESLQQSIDFCANAGITHVSAYMLKIEDGTPFATQKELLVLPNEDETCAFYLKTCEELEKAGFMQYEISNFAQNGFESRHNLKYWNCEEYLGIGPSAHSFINGKRFYYEQDLQAFLNAREPVQDGIGGDFEEYAMLRLRLNEGLTQRETLERYGFDIPIMMWERARSFAKEQLLTVDVKGIRFTPEGFLLSNVIIGELLTNMG